MEATKEIRNQYIQKTVAGGIRFIFTIFIFASTLSIESVCVCMRASNIHNFTSSPVHRQTKKGRKKERMGEKMSCSERYTGQGGGNAAGADAG